MVVVAPNENIFQKVMKFHHKGQVDQYHGDLVSIIKGPRIPVDEAALHVLCITLKFYRFFCLFAFPACP